jgi:hypothetical protein
VLARAGTPEARQAVQALARGRLDSWLTSEAWAVLRRLARFTP